MISEDQLKTWSNVGADTGSAKTYERIKNIIKESSFSRKNDLDIFLQGSYANTTHIRADSDVDIIVLLKTVWNANTSKLSQSDKSVYDANTSNSEYGHHQLRDDLVRIFGDKVVSVGNKSIVLNLGNGYLKADVIPCLSYRIYHSFSNSSKYSYTEGVSIRKKDGTIIHNFPKQHIENGTKKHQATNEYYKKIVRIFKNMRNKLIEEGKLKQNVAPSYFIECLFYNVPNNNFGNDLQSSVLNSIKWLLDNNGNLSNSKCQNEITQLFGSEETQWNTTDCHTFLIAISKLFVGGQNA